jgi:hypothetical protein
MAETPVPDVSPGTLVREILEPYVSADDVSPTVMLRYSCVLAVADAMMLIPSPAERQVSAEWLITWVGKIIEGLTPTPPPQEPIPGPPPDKPTTPTPIPVDPSNPPPILPHPTNTD